LLLINQVFASDLGNQSSPPVHRCPIRVKTGVFHHISYALMFDNNKYVNKYMGHSIQNWSELETSWIYFFPNKFSLYANCI